MAFHWPVEIAPVGMSLLGLIGSRGSVLQSAQIHRGLLAKNRVMECQNWFLDAAI